MSADAVAWGDHAPRGTALVTGASSGIGAAFAARLARRGHDLIAVARRADRLDALKARLEREFGVRVDVLVADLARDEGLRAVESRIAADSALELLINNAGFSSGTPFSALDVAAIDALIGVDVLAIARLTRAAIPGMIARGRGGIVNLSSITAFWTAPDPTQSLYVAARAFVNAFTRGVHREVRGTGVRVQALCAGLTRTEALEALLSRYPIPDSMIMSPEDLVETSLIALERDEVLCLPSLPDAGLLARLDQIQDAILAQARAAGTPSPRYAADAGLD